MKVEGVSFLLPLSLASFSSAVDGHPPGSVAYGSAITVGPGGSSVAPSDSSAAPTRAAEVRVREDYASNLLAALRRGALDAPLPRHRKPSPDLRITERRDEPMVAEVGPVGASTAYAQASCRSAHPPYVHSSTGRYAPQRGGAVTLRLRRAYW